VDDGVVYFAGLRRYPGGYACPAMVAALKAAGLGAYTKVPCPQNFGEAEIFGGVPIDGIALIEDPTDAACRHYVVRVSLHGSEQWMDPWDGKFLPDLNGWRWNLKAFLAPATK
jgi:hypothetical protein